MIDEILRVSPAAGTLTRCDAWAIGRAASRLGAGQPLALLHHAGRDVEHARAHPTAAFVVGNHATPRALFHGTVE